MHSLYGQCHSWNMVDDDFAVKAADKSVFLYHGTGIPAKCRWFWKAQNIAGGEHLNIELSCQGVAYQAYIKLGKTGRTRMVWHADLTKVLKSMFPNAVDTQVYPNISFLRKGDACYELKCGLPEGVKDDFTAESPDYLDGIDKLIESGAEGFRVDVGKAPVGSRGAARSSKPGAKKVDYERSARAKTKIGLAGELAVLQYEKNRLSNAGIHKEIEHTSRVKGDGAGYDIQSYDLDGAERHIEVKTTSGNGDRPFYITANELQFSQEHPESYALYRLYNFDPVTGHSNLYICEGDISKWVELKPENYVVTGFKAPFTT